MKHVPMADWGKDHWSMLAYVETLCVDATTARKGTGEIDWAKCRVNEKKHPLLARNSVRFKPEYGTRLSGFFGKGDKINPKRRLNRHDDVDCLDDLEAEKMVEILSLINGFVVLKSVGREMAARLRAHKSRGGYFANFNPAEAVSV